MDLHELQRALELASENVATEADGKLDDIRCSADDVLGSCEDAHDQLKEYIREHGGIAV